MISFFKRKPVVQPVPIITDIHSHLLASLDDGVKSVEEAIDLILEFKRLGYTKLITTPHIMSDRYRNTTAMIQERLEELRKILQAKNIQIEIEAAAEYYLDEVFFRKLIDHEPLLTFGKNYLLFETNFFSEPLNLKEFIFKAISSGYKLVLAHPERYQYMDLKKAQDLKDRGLFFQINLSSLTGFYSRPIQKMTYQLIDKGWVDFLGSDCHNAFQAGHILEARKNKYYNKALALPLLNNTL